MAFNTIEYLKAGKVDFISSLTPYDYNNLIAYIRKNSDKIEIINGFLKKIIDTHYCFCFAIIYDIDEYQEQTLYLLDKYLGFNYLTQEHLLNLLKNTKWGKEYILQYQKELLQKDEETLNAIFSFIFKDLDHNYDLIKIFYLNQDLHLRYLFMSYIIKNHPELINVIYDDFTKYLTSITYQENEQLTFLPTLMDINDICSLAVLSLKKLSDKSIWLKLKEHILTNYQENTLASNLLEQDKIEISPNSHCYTYQENPTRIQEFNQDADRLFTTSSNYKLHIYHYYSQAVSATLISQFANFIKMFERPDIDQRLDSNLNSIYYYSLGQKLQKYVEQYLDLSKSKETGYISSGATLSCYRLGDYVIKLVRTKWSCEKIICPNLYLIIRNIEEDYVRDKNGLVLAGLEVQKYLTRSAKNVPSYVLSKFTEELSRLGYYSRDTLINGTCGDNCMLLDNYTDADIKNPEDLPSWFKKYPLVLVDRDDVYKLENTYPKTRHRPFY